MSKSCIISVTAGDFEYIDEWIEYHHNLGVDLFLIGYNGPSEKISNYKYRDYVKFVDFSYNESNKNIFYNKTGGFSGWHSNNMDIRDMARMQKIENILFDYARWMYTDYEYAIVIDTDEFIRIKTGETNINKFLDEKFPVVNSSISIQMQFMKDTGVIYKDGRNVFDKFTDTCDVYDFGQGSKKCIIRLNHIDVKRNKIKLLSPHSCSLFLYGFDLNHEEIVLNHYWTKSLEEWIEKMKPEIDQDYFNRFRGHIFYDFFFGAAHNELTIEKALAIPELLKKHNIEYDFLKEEPEKFVNAYNNIINQ